MTQTNATGRAAGAEDEAIRRDDFESCRPEPGDPHAAGKRGEPGRFRRACPGDANRSPPATPFLSPPAAPFLPLPSCRSLAAARTILAPRSPSATGPSAPHRRNPGSSRSPGQPAPWTGVDRDREVPGGNGLDLLFRRISHTVPVGDR
jgi:hypothetical protein